jgi:asparagine synthetase B (glutamine-hydrolysing)
VAGVVFTIGKETSALHDRCYAEFTRAKNAVLSHQEKSNSFCLSKFCRNNENDMNSFVSENMSIWVVGTLIYKNSMEKAALKTLNQDLAGNRIEDLSQYFDGPFCLIVKESSREALWVVTDHAGILNLYKYQKGQNVAFSTSAVALSRALPVSPNSEGIAQFLRNAMVCDSKTIYNEIELLEPASIYFIEYAPKVKIHLIEKYWSGPSDIAEDISFDEARDLVAKRLVESTEVLANEKVVYDLTAGFDTRLVLSSVLSTRSSQRDIQTFVFGPNGSREVKLVKELCGALRVGNYHLTLPGDWRELFCEYVLRALELTDGEENACVYAPILWAQEFKAKDHSYSVNGLGGELYRDFWWMQEVVWGKKPANLERLVTSRVLQYEYDYSIFSSDWRKRMENVGNVIRSKYENTISDMDVSRTYNTLQIDSIYLRQKIRRWAGRTISTSNQLIRTVAPLAFKKCLEAGMSIPPKYKRNGKLVRAVIELLSPKLAQGKMLSGVPCQTLRLNNFYKFIPLVSDISKRGIRKVSQRLFKRTVLLDKSLAFPISLYFISLLSDTRCKGLLSYGDMLTQELYRREDFNWFLASSKKPGFPYYQQLGNLLTLELRMRGDNLVAGLGLK